MQGQAWFYMLSDFLTRVCSAQAEVRSADQLTIVRLRVGVC